MGLSHTALANAVHVPPRRINEIVLGKRAVTADTALRLARYFGLSEGFFLGLQTDYELMARRREIGDQLKSIRPRAAILAVGWLGQAMHPPIAGHHLSRHETAFLSDGARPEADCMRRISHNLSMNSCNRGAYRGPVCRPDLCEGKRSDLISLEVDRCTSARNASFGFASSSGAIGILASLT